MYPNQNHSFERNRVVTQSIHPCACVYECERSKERVKEKKRTIAEPEGIEAGGAG